MLHMKQISCLLMNSTTWGRVSLGKAFGGNFLEEIISWDVQDEKVESIPAVGKKKKKTAWARQGRSLAGAVGKGAGPGRWWSSEQGSHHGDA